MSSLSSRFITAAGVPLGAKKPSHSDTSKPGKPDSATVGTSGSDGSRFAVLIASDRSLPVLACGSSGETRIFRGQLHVLRDEKEKAIGAMAIFTSADAASAGAG